MKATWMTRVCAVGLTAAAAVSCSASSGEQRPLSERRPSVVAPGARGGGALGGGVEAPDVAVAPASEAGAVEPAAAREGVVGAAPSAEEATVEAPLYWGDLTTPSRPIYARPEELEAYVGTLREGFPFPVYEEVEGPGCREGWAKVGPRGWVCGQFVKRLEATPPPPSDDPLPWTYMTVFKDTEIHDGPRKSLATGKLRKRKSIVSVIEQDKQWVRAYPDQWLKKRDLIPKPARFSSLESLQPGGKLEAPVAYVRYNHVTAWPERPESDAHRRKMPKKSRTEVKRFSVHPIVSSWPEGELSRADWVQLPEGWVEHWRLAVVESAARPGSLGEGEKWLRVDLSEQTITAYEGDAPVYVTLVSTGKGEDKSGEGEDKDTPTGIFRITNKQRSGRMSGGSGESYHYLSDVPWVQYFNGGIALHGVYWHNALGWPHSNGCVNLAPKDAKWLFDWTEATLPAGWYTLMTDAERPGTWVVVAP